MSHPPVTIQINDDRIELEGAALDAFWQQKNLDDVAHAAEVAASVAAIASVAELRASALAKLAALGLTAAEIASL